MYSYAIILCLIAVSIQSGSTAPKNLVPFCWRSANAPVNSYSFLNTYRAEFTETSVEITVVGNGSAEAKKGDLEKVEKKIQENTTLPGTWVFGYVNGSDVGVSPIRLSFPRLEPLEPENFKLTCQYEL